MAWHSLEPQTCRRVTSSTCSRNFPHKLLPLPLSIGRYVEQALGDLIGCLSSLACLRKLTLKKGNPSSKILYLPTGRGQHYGALHLHSRHPLPCLSLS
jgi:hypothetical protein